MCINYTQLLHHPHNVFTLYVLMDVFFTVGYAGPYPRLVKRRCPGTLAGVVSISIQAVLVAFQLALLFLLHTQSW